MRKLCVFVFLVVTLQYCISCQKQLSFDTPPDVPGGDSITLIKTIKTINYDANDVFNWQTQETYTYNKDLNRTVVDHIDSSEHTTGEVENYTEVFQYDGQNRLLQFTSTSKYEPDPKIDFSYNSSGDISKVVIVDNWLNKTIECNFTSVTQNGLKTITEYDTSGFYGNSDTRPEITKSVFDADNKLVKQSIFSTSFRQPGGFYKDTLVADLFYNSSNYVYKTKQFFVYYNSPPDYLYASPSNDSVVYSRTGNNTVLANSFLNLYKNMYWFSISESTGFATAMMSANNLLAYFGAPLSTAEQWHFEQDPSNNLHNLGTFRNEFDANGLPVKSIFPKNFANKYGGKAEIWYTYIKVKK